jgi:MinD superfamily P-loop ATPase
LTEVGSPIGVVEVGDAGRVTLVTGRLDVGRALSPPLIHAVRRHADPARLTIVDSPPGTACPLVAAAAGADYALLVAEPSRFGIHDLGLVVSSLREIGVPLGVVVNRSRGEDGDLGAFCEREGIEILLTIPESREAAAAGARGRLLVEEVPGMRSAFEDLWTKVFAAAVPAGKGGRP